MPPATANVAPEALFRDDDWDLLIADIEKHKVVPVVGPDLLIKGNDPSETLHQHLASELMKGLPEDKAGFLTPGCTLMDICSHRSHTEKRRLIDDILKLMLAAKWPLPLPLTQLAGIDGFDLYVSTTFDSLLFDAVRRTRIGVVNHLYGLKCEVPDIEIYPKTDRLRMPVVYQVFGGLDGAGDCALSEEQVLQFVQRLQDPDPGNRPKFLFDTLARRNLLFLGCGFPGWLGRFFRRVLKGKGELRDRGVFAHSLLLEDPGYVLFLERQEAKLWLNDSGVGFVNELHRRWIDAHPSGARPEVFISYAREDEDVAKDLTAMLERAGASVWLDRERLRSGEIWNDDIIAAIQDSPVFVPVISRHSARTEPRYCHKEWDLASRMLGKRICPLSTDATALPEQFADRHARQLAEKGDLVRDVIEFLEETRKQQVPRE